jgi:RNA polymerase-binding transcription factor DksA
VLHDCLEVQEVKSSEVPRLERYLRFHLAEVLEELGSSHEVGSDADSTWSAKWGSSVNILRECLLQSREDINSALARICEGTYGNCIGCGNEIDLRRLEVVPWAKFCIECKEESDQSGQADNRFYDRSRCLTAESPKEAEDFLS